MSRQYCQVTTINVRNPKAEDSRFYFLNIRTYKFHAMHYPFISLRETLVIYKGRQRHFFLDITFYRNNDFFILVIRNQVDVIIVMLDSIKNYFIIWRIYFGYKTGT